MFGLVRFRSLRNSLTLLADNDEDLLAPSRQDAKFGYCFFPWRLCAFARDTPRLVGTLPLLCLRGTCLVGPDSAAGR